MNELQGNIKQVYIMTKIWKAHQYFGATYKGYYIKKLLLDPSRQEQAKEDPEQTFRDTLHKAEGYIFLDS